MRGNVRIDLALINENFGAQSIVKYYEIKHTMQNTHLFAMSIWAFAHNF
jgi:hypothetical protein